MSHRYPRTERDLRWLAVNFSAGRLGDSLPERLECLAAYHRTAVELEKANSGRPNDFAGAVAAYEAACARMCTRLREACGNPSEEFAYPPGL